MEATSWFSVGSVVFLVVGAVVGAAAGHLLSPAIGEAKKLRADLDRMKHEHDAYRSSVNSHFRKTADLVGEMTKSYAAVYDHLAGGARRFCDDDSSTAVPFEPLPGALASPVVESADDAMVAAAVEPAELVEEEMASSADGAETSETNEVYAEAVGTAVPERDDESRTPV